MKLPSMTLRNIAQWHLIELLKVGLMPLRVSNYFLIKSDELNELFQKLDRNGIEQYKRR